MVPVLPMPVYPDAFGPTPLDPLDWIDPPAVFFDNPYHERTKSWRMYCYRMLVGPN